MQERPAVRKVSGKDAAPTGRAPAIVLADPKYAHNVGMVIRLASCYGIGQVWYTGERVASTSLRGSVCRAMSG